MEYKVPIETSKAIVELLAQHSGAEIINSDTEAYFLLPTEKGEGFIRGIEFNNGIGLFHLEATFNEDFVLHYEYGNEQPLRMIFCVEGELIHKLLPDNVIYKLEPLQGSMALSSEKNQQVLHIPANKKIKFYSIEISKELYAKGKDNSKSVSSKLISILGNNSGDKHFLYENNYSLMIAEVLKEIDKNNFEGLVRMIFLEAKVLEIISYQLKQYQDDLLPYSEQVVLRKKDISQLFEAKQTLISNLQAPPTIKELAKLVGTNENKLKKGFKKVFGVTINNFITEKRLEQARILLAEEQLQVKEISQKVGYKSTSAFTKVFKKKFGVTPGQFLKRYSL